MAFHLLKSSIVEGVKGFFINGHNGKEFIISPDYKDKVLSRSKYEFEASLIFLLESEALTSNDINEIQLLRDYRNKLAHDIPSSIYVKKHFVDPDKIDRAGYFLNKVDNFWGCIEADTNPDFTNEDIDYEGITSIRYQTFQIIAEIVRETKKDNDT
ncbi:MAG: hypothetical protein COA90_00030 [Gammaproteobacteria bacterium]|nr:MAG: hypothetical protein COA90_00030 [Gammaproteobacteria bacterium]